MSALSNSVMPASIAASTTRRDDSRSIRPPKSLQPSASTETTSPELPSGRYSIDHSSVVKQHLAAAAGILQVHGPRRIVEPELVRDHRVERLPVFADHVPHDG